MILAGGVCVFCPKAMSRRFPWTGSKCFPYSHTIEAAMVGGRAEVGCVSTFQGVAAAAAAAAAVAAGSDPVGVPLP